MIKIEPKECLEEMNVTVTDGIESIQEASTANINLSQTERSVKTDEIYIKEENLEDQQFQEECSENEKHSLGCSSKGANQNINEDLLKDEIDIKDEICEMDQSVDDSSSKNHLTREQNVVEMPKKQLVENVSRHLNFLGNLLDGPFLANQFPAHFLENPIAETSGNMDLSYDNEMELNLAEDEAQSNLQENLLETPMQFGSLVGINPGERKKETVKEKISNTKKRKQSGLPYTTYKGKAVDKKEMVYINCSCKFKCKENISKEERINFHSEFWKLADWESQSNFIASSVIICLPKRRTVASSKINFIRKYFLGDVQVCQKVFLSTLSITHLRVNYCLKKCKEGNCSTDQKVLLPIKNVMHEVTRNVIRQFLDAFPKYKSHYLNSNKRYLHPDLTHVKLYELYKEYSIERNIESINYLIFKEIFNDFDVGIYAPKSDTCQKCDQLNEKIKCINGDEKMLNDELFRHNRGIEMARAYMKKVQHYAKNNQSILAFSFNLQKSQPLPCLNTSIAFFKRQLWLYNLGINNFKNNKATMCIWTEIDGKRESNEICSSLYNFLIHRCEDLKRIVNIVTFSDGCGDENSNRNFVSFMMWFCQNYNINEWEHTYLEPGHSFLPNDIDFAMIEKKKKQQQYIYLYEDWINVIKKAQCKQSFDVIEMKNNFLNFDDISLQRQLKNNPQKQKFCWLELKWCKVCKDSSLMMYKTSCDPSEFPKNIDFPLANNVKSIANMLQPIEAPGKISKEKYDDIQSLLQYVPPIYHDIYNKLPH